MKALKSVVSREIARNPDMEINQKAVDELAAVGKVIEAAQIVVDFVTPFVSEWVGVASSARPCKGDLDNLSIALKELER